MWPCVKFGFYHRWYRLRNVVYTIYGSIYWGARAPPPLPTGEKIRASLLPNILPSFDTTPPSSPDLSFSKHSPQSTIPNNSHVVHSVINHHSIEDRGNVPSEHIDNPPTQAELHWETQYPHPLIQRGIYSSTDTNLDSVPSSYTADNFHSPPPPPPSPSPTAQDKIILLQIKTWV